MRLDLDVKYVRDQITALLLANPELADDEVLREDMIEGTTTTFEFLSKIVRMIGDNKTLADATYDYIAELQARRDRFTRRNDALRSFVFKIMTSADLQKVQLSEGTLSIRAGRPKVIITDESLLQDHYCRIKRVPDKSAIATALRQFYLASKYQVPNYQTPNQLYHFASNRRINMPSISSLPE